VECQLYSRQHCDRPCRATSTNRSIPRTSMWKFWMLWTCLMHSVRLVPRHGSSEWWMNVMFTGTVMLTGATRGRRAPHSRRDTIVTRPPPSHVVVASVSSATQTHTLIRRPQFQRRCSYYLLRLCIELWVFFDVCGVSSCGFWARLLPPVGSSEAERSIISEG